MMGLWLMWVVALQVPSPRVMIFTALLVFLRGLWRIRIYEQLIGFLHSQVFLIAALNLSFEFRIMDIVPWICLSVFCSFFLRSLQKLQRHPILDDALHMQLPSMLRLFFALKVTGSLFILSLTVQFVAENLDLFVGVCSFVLCGGLFLSVKSSFMWNHKIDAVGAV